MKTFAVGLAVCFELTLLGLAICGLIGVWPQRSPFGGVPR